MNRTNLTVGLLFLALGLYLVISASFLPDGIGRLPGPGFFPAAVGALLAMLAAFLLVEAVRTKQGAHFSIGNGWMLAGAAGLLLLYLLLWGTVSFAPRTALFLFLFLRLAGERRRSSAVVSLVLTTGVILAFQYGLRVSFD